VIDQQAEEQPAQQAKPGSAQEDSGPLALRAGRPARWEWIFVATLSAICLAYWIAHFHKFTIPSSDTPEFLNLARELWSFQAPSYYKRMPLFPLLIGLVAKVVFSEAPHLDAALALNVFFSAGTLVLLYLFARRMADWAAILPLMFFVASRLTHNMAGQALVEPIMSCALLGAAASRLKDRWRPLYSRLVTAAALLAAGVSIAVSCRDVWQAQGATARMVYALFAVALMMAAAVYGPALVRRPRWAGIALGLGILALVAPRVGSEVPAHASDAAKICYHRWGSVMAGRWLARNMKPGEKALAFHLRELERGANLEDGRVLNVAGMKAANPVELAREMREKKVSYVICTHYRIPDESDVRRPVLVRRYRPELMDAFKNGGRVPGFELVATIAAPPVAKRETACVYRVLPQPPPRAPEGD